MNSSDENTGPPKELAQLLRLRQARVDAAAAAVQEQKRVLEKANEDVEAAKKKLDASNTTLENFVEYTFNDGVTERARLGDCFDAYDKHLKGEVTRSDNALTREKNLLAKAEQKLAELTQLWRRERARRDGVEDALKRSKRSERMNKDRKAEAEVEEMASSRSPGGGQSQGMQG